MWPNTSCTRSKHQVVASMMGWSAATAIRMAKRYVERNKPKRRKHAFAFAGLLRCAHDGCTVTAELQKSKYVYYRCSHGRGKCPLPYMREQEVSDRMGEVLKDIYVPETIAQTIVDSLQSDSTRAEAERQKRIVATQQRIAALCGRMDQMYEDKLDGKIDDEFWTRKMNEFKSCFFALSKITSNGFL